MTGAVRWKTYSVPAPGEPGSETWKDRNNAWQTGGGAFYSTGSYDPALNLTYWGSGNPVPGLDATYRPGDNLYTSSALAFDAATGKIRWFHQYTPNDTRDYDETGSHIIIDTKVNGEDRKLLFHRRPQRFRLYVRPHQRAVPEGGADREGGELDARASIPKTGRPLDYDPDEGCAGLCRAAANSVEDKVARRVCPNIAGGTNFWPSSYSRATRPPLRAGAGRLQPHHHRHQRPCDRPFHRRRRRRGRPRFGCAARHRSRLGGGEEAASRCPIRTPAGVLTTAGGIVVTAMIDGTVLAYDDRTFEELWRINVGNGFNAAPMTYAVGGKQYIAIASGLCCAGAARPVPRNSRGRVARTPELRLQGNANVVWVFGL